jgi:hypothetical protein
LVLVLGALSGLVPLGNRVGPDGRTYECGSVYQPLERDIWGLCDGTFLIGNSVGIVTFVVGVGCFVAASRLKRQNSP